MKNVALPEPTPVAFTVGDHILRGDRFAAAGIGRSSSLATSPAVLFVHGWASNRIGYAARAKIVAEELGAVCLTFDLAGHGDSTGNLSQLTVKDHLADLVAAFDELSAEQAVHAERIAICGSSYGAYLAAWVSGVRPVARLVLRAPALYNDAELSSRLDAPRKSDADADANSFIRTLRAYSMPVLILESEHDETIPHAVIQIYLENLSRAEHAVLKGAGHSLVTDSERAAFIKWIVHFLAPL